MKRTYLFLLSIIMGYLSMHAANVIPETGKWYNIVQTPSGMNFGLDGTNRPAVQTPSSDINQIFEFIPVDGLTDTYYIRNAGGLYMNKNASSGWSMIYEAAINDTQSQWIVVNVDTNATCFRLQLVFNQKYVATDAITNNSWSYCDKAVDNARGVFYLKDAFNPEELNIQYEALDLGDLNGVYENLVLPTELGNNGVTVKWKSSNAQLIDSLGHVTMPEKFDMYVTLTATLNLVVGSETYTKTKIFKAKVLSLNGTPETIAEWTFAPENISVTGDTVKVTDASDAAYIGVLKNDASIRTIGTTKQYNVLDLGNGTGYFDMGKAIGEAIYTLGDYTVSGFFYIDSTYTALNSDGNFLWTFSNTADAPTDMNGYMLGRMGNMCMEITPSYWNSGNQGIYQGAAAPKGAWHHYAYVQNGTTGNLFLDGIQVMTGSISNFPYIALPKAGRTGTDFNWLGRSQYPSDVYLRKTLLYDFTVYSIPLTGDNLLIDLGIPETINSLNQAYAENSNVKDDALQTEYNALILENTTALTSDIVLPELGTQDPNVNISWSSSNTEVISNAGKVTRPNYHDVNVILTATLSKGIQTLSKSFDATVLMNPGTQMTNDLMVHFDFAHTVGNVVTDLGEKKLQGTIMNDASIRQIGTDASGKFVVLDLGDSIGYFDMGVEVGKIMAGVEDYTLSAYYRIDTAYHDLGVNGNFIWNLSNTNNVIANPNAGYIIASLKNLGVSASLGNWQWANGNRAVNANLAPIQGEWHNITYTQSGTLGTLYLDGIPSAVADTMINTPKTIFSQYGKSGSPYNWIGKSCYEANGDVYLRQTLVHDLRIYKRALSEIEVIALELNVGEVLSALEAAYQANPNVSNAVETIRFGDYKLSVDKNSLKILHLNGKESVQILDLTGRLLSSSRADEYTLNPGIYIVRINQYTAKVMIR